MTDGEYIQAFYTSNQRGIRDAYDTLKNGFMSFLKFKCPHLPDIFYEDVYHEAIITLQQNILSQKLTEGNLSSSLSSYLNSVGIFCAMHLVRERKELSTTDAVWNALTNGSSQIDMMDSEEAKYGLQNLWIEEVEQPFKDWRSRNPLSERDERDHFYDELTCSFLNKHKAKANPIFDDVVEDVDMLIERERNKIIRETVAKMEKPCAPILLGAIWEGKSNAQLAIDLAYRTTDVLKNQKSRCLGKVKKLIKDILSQCGYNYE